MTETEKLLQQEIDRDYENIRDDKEANNRRTAEFLDRFRDKYTMGTIERIARKIDGSLKQAEIDLANEKAKAKGIIQEE